MNPDRRGYLKGAAAALALQAVPTSPTPRTILIVGAGIAVLRTMFGRTIPEPIAFQRTRWAADPFAGGAYSFNAVGSSNGDRAMLAQPVAGRLFWAGEATHAAYPGTVHGAWLSGLRAAQEITRSA